MKKILLFGGFGLLPVWVIGWMSFQALYDTGPGSAGVLYYWVLVPMLTPLTLGIAAATLLAHNLASGSARRKFGMGALTFVVLVGAVCATLAIRHYQSKRNHEKASHERELAEEFTKQHPDVIKLAGRDAGVVQIEDADGTRFNIILSGTRKVSTVVAVDRSSEEPRFSISCLSEVRPQVDLTDTCRN